MDASNSSAMGLPERDFARNGVSMNTKSKLSIRYLSSKNGGIFLPESGEIETIARKTTSRLFGLDAVDWSLLTLGVTLASLLLVLAT